MMRITRRRTLAGLGGLVAADQAVRAKAAAGAAPFDITRYVYVPSATTPEVTVIDDDTISLAARLDVGVIARQAVVSREAATLIASDGQSAAVSLVDVITGARRRLVLPAPAQRLTIGTSGRLAAVSDLAGGTIALVSLGDDIATDRIEGVITGLPPLRDVMFGDLDTMLYIASARPGGIGVIDVARSRYSHDIATIQPAPAGIATLARTPDGQQVLAQPQGGGPISVLDPEQGKAVGQLVAGPGAAGMFTSGTGAYLFVPDNDRATLAVFRSVRLDDPVTLPGAAGVTGVYSAWLDSVAFLPSAARDSLLVYDLDAMRLTGEIALGGIPERGAVTSDSRTLYLPLRDPPRIVAVAGDLRRVHATFDLPGPPLAALVAGGWGICH